MDQSTCRFPPADRPRREARCSRGRSVLAQRSPWLVLHSANKGRSELVFEDLKGRHAPLSGRLRRRGRTDGAATRAVAVDGGPDADGESGSMVERSIGGALRGMLRVEWRSRSDGTGGGSAMNRASSTATSAHNVDATTASIT